MTENQSGRTQMPLGLSWILFHLKKSWQNFKGIFAWAEVSVPDTAPLCLPGQELWPRVQRAPWMQHQWLALVCTASPTFSVHRADLYVSSAQQAAGAGRGMAHYLVTTSPAPSSHCTFLVRSETTVLATPF